MSAITVVKERSVEAAEEILKIWDDVIASAQ